MDFQYRVSVIVPIYNQEPYLEETIACLVKQTIPPRDMEILLIDDGSTDRSPEMCDGYAAKYENVKVVHKPNGGLSDARNCGIDNSHGKYIMYLDGDDTLQEDTVLSVVDFFDDHYDEVDLVTYPSITIRQGQRVSPHYRYRTFNEPGVYDLTLGENVFAAVTRIEVCVKNEGANNVKFSPDRTFRHEDMKYCTDVLLRKLKVGFCNKGAYIYAQQAEGLQNTYFYAYYLFEPTMAFWEEEFNKYEDEVPKYLQALYVSDLCWKLRASILEPLHYSEEDLAKADARIDALLDRCDVDSITKHPAVDPFYRAYLLQRRSKSKVVSVAGSNALALVVDDQLSYVRQKIEIIMFRAKHRGGELKLYGMLKSPCFQFGGVPELFANVSIDGVRSRVYVDLSESSWGYNGTKTKINTFYDFEFSLKVCERGSVEFFVNYEGETLATNYYFMGTSAFTMKNPKRTMVLDLDDYLYSFQNNAFFVRKIASTERRKIKKSIRLQGKYTTKKAISRYSAERLIAQGRRIWLYHDCHGVEKNNAYDQYMHDIQMDDGVERYYVVNDSLRSKKHLFTAAQMRNVISFGSKQHKLLFLAAERIITAYIERVNWVPFGPNLAKYYQDLFNAEVVYLQHGVLHSHQPWKYSRDRVLIDREVVSTQFEIDNLKKNYCFTDDTILASGMPRYDFIDQNAKPKRKILFAPSWRKFLVRQKSDGQWLSVPGIFEKSDFYVQLSAFLNSEELSQLLEKYDYEIDVKLHPIFAELYSDYLHFDKPRVHIAPPSVNDSEYAVFITDFSSYRFDFVYLKRAIMYFFPDEVMFRAGMCDYSRTDLPLDGTFGDLATTGEDAIRILEGILERDGQPKEEYARQMDGFFLYYDNNQRDRIYESLIHG